MNDVDVDVIVVGSGVAGLTAALEARRAGATVLVIEAMTELGGVSRLSGGHMMAAGTRWQQAQGIQDSPEALVHDYLALTRASADPGLVRAFAENAPAALDWLVGLGVEFEDDTYPAGAETTRRDHAPVGEGPAVMKTLISHIRRAGVDVLIGQRVTALVHDDEGVSGVRTDDAAIRARAVVLACGGLGSNPELLDEWLPITKEAGARRWYIGEESSRGDALGLTAEVGAQIVGKDRGNVILTPDFGDILELDFPGWLVIVDGEGRRFLDESSPYPTHPSIVQAQRGPIHAVFDEAARLLATRSAAAGAKLVHIPGPHEFKWLSPRIDAMVDQGVVVRASTWAELATMIGVPARQLEGTVERYNSDLEAGAPDQFAKPRRLARSLVTPPFYATRLWLAHVAVTAVGPRIDASARVIGSDSRPIVGLFAAGECAGGVIGDVYVGTGNSFGSCVVFGRLAGAGAARRSRIPISI